MYIHLSGDWEDVHGGSRDRLLVAGRDTERRHRRPAVARIRPPATDPLAASAISVGPISRRCSLNSLGVQFGAQVPQTRIFAGLKLPFQNGATRSHEVTQRGDLALNLY